MHIFFSFCWHPMVFYIIGVITFCVVIFFLVSASIFNLKKIFDLYNKEGLIMGISLVYFCNNDRVVSKHHECRSSHHEHVDIYLFHLTDMLQSSVTDSCNQIRSYDDSILLSNFRPVLFYLCLVPTTACYSRILILIKSRCPLR